MSTTDIDSLITEFYSSMSFQTGQRPDYDGLLLLFDQYAVLTNNSFGAPLRFTAESYIQSLQSQVADKDLRQFIQREIYAKTEIFGKVAQRVSVYEYSFADHVTERMPRGINFVQCIQVEGNWRILAMSWADENENNILPYEYTAGR